jgi:hypothetical protein
VVAPGGRILWGDELLVVFAREILTRKPGAIVISEVKCSQRLFDDVERHGGRAIMWKAGHSLIKAKMKEMHAEVGGEMSGHMFFADRFFGYDDAIYAACRLLEILAGTSGGVLDLLDGLPAGVRDAGDPHRLLRRDQVRRHREGARAPGARPPGERRRRRPRPVRRTAGASSARRTPSPPWCLRFEASSEAARDAYQALVEQVVAEVRAEVEPTSR